jgi:hypothetical protein
MGLAADELGTLYVFGGIGARGRNEQAIIGQF